MRRIKNEELDDIKEKIDTILTTAKTFNDTIAALNVLDGMLICILEKVSEKRIADEISGIRLYLSEIMEEMENLREL